MWLFMQGSETEGGNEPPVAESAPATPTSSVTDGNSGSAITNTVTKARGKKRKADDELADVARQCLMEIKTLGSESEGTKCMDDESKYSEYVVCEMRKLTNEITKHVVKAEIQNVFLKAHLGHYNNTYSVNPDFGTFSNAVIPPQVNRWSRPPLSSTHSSTYRARNFSHHPAASASMMSLLDTGFDAADVSMQHGLQWSQTSFGEKSYPQQVGPFPSAQSTSPLQTALREGIVADMETQFGHTGFQPLRPADTYDSPGC